MNAAAIIEKMQAVGLALSTDGSDLIITPPGRLSDRQRAYLRAHKAELLAELTAANEAVQDGSVWVTAFTPAGNPVNVLAKSPEQAEFIRRMNPPPR